MPFGFSAPVWEGAKKEALYVLIEQARLGEPICYSDLAASIDGIKLEAHDPRLANLVGELSADEDAEGRGMISVLVVHKNGDMMPGQGFFTLAQELGRDVSNKEKCWIDEFNRVTKCWQAAD